MKKVIITLIVAIAGILQMAAQCTVTATITTYIPGYCYDSPPFFEATPTVDCPDASFMVIKWKEGENVITETTTTDFVSPSYVSLGGQWNLGMPVADICYEIHIFDANYQEIATASDCELGVWIPQLFFLAPASCENDCFNIIAPGGGGNYTITIGNDAPFTMIPFNDTYCFTAPGSYNVIATDQFGCISTNYFDITADLLDDLHTVSGTVFNDADQNGIWDSWTETTVNEIGIVTLEELNITAAVNASGGFMFNDIPEGNYTYTFSDPDNNWVLSTTNTYVHNSTDCGPIYIGAIPDFDLMEQVSYLADVWSNNTIHCENGFNPGIWLSNSGNQPLNGTITMVFDAALVPEYLTGVEPYNSYSNGTMVWNVVDLAAGESMFYQCHIQGPGFTFMGDVFEFTFNMTLDDGMGGTFIDTDWLINPTVVCSFDPNDKNAIPEGFAEPHFVLADDEIEYRIRFQNTGNAPATNVEVVDSLDVAHLDLSTFEVKFASHELNTVVDVDGVVHFHFDNINLPDSASDEPGSQGFVVYKIKTRTDAQGWDEINNTAYIYFDSNPAIITNTTFHTIYDCAWNEGLPASQEMCPGIASITATASNFIDIYNWSLDGTPLEESGSFVQIPFSTSGQHELVLEIGNSLCTTTSTMMVTVYPNPNITITYDQNTQLISGPASYSYNWYVNGELQSNTSNSIDPWENFADWVSIYALVTSPEGCDGQTNTITFTSVSESKDSQIALYPNPVSDFSTLKLSQGIWNVQLYNSMGQKTKEWSNVQQSLQIQSEGLSDGTYFLRAIHENGRSESVMIEVKK
jgi:uncharacterized repeat protein (TIGR01451 family)